MPGNKRLSSGEIGSSALPKGPVGSVTLTGAWLCPDRKIALASAETGKQSIDQSAEGPGENGEP